MLRVSIIIRKTENRRTKFINYEIEVRLHELLKVKIRLTETRYNLLKIKLKLDFKKAEETLRVPIRFVKGLRVDESIYYQYEIILALGLYESGFFKSDEIELINALLSKVIKFENRPEKIENLQLDYSE